ncbi:MAG TPA: hypothetical protein VEX66_08475 [Microlunatus sp.]|nr:hypothetical protein [Microlunatus sp.]
MTGHVVSTGPDREQQPTLPSQVDAVDDVGFARAPNDEARLTIDRKVLDHPHLVIPGITGSTERSPEHHAEFGDLVVGEIHGSAGNGGK